MNGRVYHAVKGYVSALQGTEMGRVMDYREAERVAVAQAVADAASAPKWDLLQVGEDWVLRMHETVVVHNDTTRFVTDIPITNAAAPMGIAIDAAMDFMDRIRENNIPPFIEDGDTKSLMQFCVTTSWKRSA